MRIPTLSDTHSDLSRTAFRGCRTVYGAKRRSEASLREVSDRKQDIPRFFSLFSEPSEGDVVLASLTGGRAVYSGGL